VVEEECRAGEAADETAAGGIRLGGNALEGISGFQRTYNY